MVAAAKKPRSVLLQISPAIMPLVALTVVCSALFVVQADRRSFTAGRTGGRESGARAGMEAGRKFVTTGHLCGVPGAEV